MVGGGAGRPLLRFYCCVNGPSGCSSALLLMNVLRLAFSFAGIGRLLLPALLLTNAPRLAFSSADCCCWRLREYSRAFLRLGP